MPDRAVRPLQREIRILIRALLVFLGTLIVALFALVISLLRTDRLAATANAATRALAPIAASASRADLETRLFLLHRENDIDRIELYRGGTLYATAGDDVPSAEVLTRDLKNGRLLFYYDAGRTATTRRGALVVGACATIATMMGLLLLILYVPKFVKPLEEMLDHAQELGVRDRGDDDARYLVHTFRQAVEKIHQQGQELDHLRDAATTRTPDIREVAGAIHRSFSSGFLALDAAGKIVAMNDAGRAMLNLPAGEDNTPGALDQLPRPFAEAVQSSLDTRAALTRREVVLDAAESLIGVTTVPLFEGEAFLGLLALFTDLTTLRAMEGRLRDLENLVGLGQMSAGIAHEFRNSLFTILGYLRLAERVSTPEAVPKIRSAETEAKRLAGAVDTLLNFARPLTVKMQSLKFDELVREVIARVASAAPEVVLSFDGPPVELHGDRDLLDVALENILRNAVDSVRQRHPDGGGRIELVLETSPHTKLSIRDNGVGLDPEEAARLLLPFQSAKAHGFGLGLPLARKIVLHHGGTLALTGAPDEGATVRIEFFA
jgi:signal transduction histidine kinase